MVKLIPVLVANSVSRNIVPGILKAIERHTMIYDMDMIMDQAAKSLGIKTKIRRNKKIEIFESDDQIVEFLAKEFLQEIDPRDRFEPGTKDKKSAFTPLGPQPGDEDEDEAQRMAAAKERGKREASPGDASVSLGQFDMKSIQLEPSWMKADLTSKSGVQYSTMIGVKAIPLTVKSDAKLHELIMWDAQIGKIMERVIRIGRYFEGILYRIWATTAGRIFNPDPEAISGNPYKDIVLKRSIISTRYVNNIYFVLNRADLRADFFEQAKRVRKLVRLGWQSFVIADDVNRSVSFCMIKFRGMCSTMPYGMLYQTLDQAKVFDDLEDVRRSSASLFRTRRPFNKILGESLAQQKLDEFSAEIFEEPKQYELLNEIEVLHEGLGQFLKKIASSPKAAFSRFSKNTLKLPSIAPERLAKIGVRIDKDFYKAYKLAQKVLSNSISKLENETLINWMAILVVIIGFMLKSGKGLMYGTREALKYLITRMRRTLSAAGKTTLKVPPEHITQVVLGTAFLGLIAYLIGHFVKVMLKTPEEISRSLQGIEVPHFVKTIMSYFKTKAADAGIDLPKIMRDSRETAETIINKAGEAKEELAGTPEVSAFIVASMMIASAAIFVFIASITLKEER